MIYLCVGGPKDGERIAIQDHDRSVVVEFPVFTGSSREITLASKAEVLEDREWVAFAYRKLNVCGVNFLVPADDDSPVKVMMQLAENYGR